MKKLLLILSVILMLSNCSQDDSSLIETVAEYNPAQHPGIQLAFRTHVKNFYDEANLRDENPDNIIGQTIESLKMIFDVDLDEQYCGYAYGFDNPFSDPFVVISTRPECWGERNEAERELLVFHELGHAILTRYHDNSQLPSGHKKSIMVSDNTLFTIYADNETDKRNYYLDELFDPNTPEPEW